MTKVLPRAIPRGRSLRSSRALAMLALLVLGGCGEDASEGKSAPAQATPPILQQRPQPPSGETAPRTRGETERTGARTQRAETGRFDFYVLSLSWSPTWCAQNDPAGRTMQCDGTRDYRTVVHGLWPQNETGFPAFCPSREADRVPEALGRSLFDIIPSMGLIGHQWRKHGTCSGLSQEAYFALVRKARARIRIPPIVDRPDSRRRLTPAAIEDAFVQGNPGLSPQAVAVTCDNGRLDEIRICFTRDLAFRTCPQVDRGGCRARDIAIPPAPNTMR